MYVAFPHVCGSSALYVHAARVPRTLYENLIVTSGGLWAVRQILSRSPISGDNPERLQRAEAAFLYMHLTEVSPTVRKKVSSTRQRYNWIYEIINEGNCICHS